MQRTVPSFPELLADCQQSAVHLEMRDVYGVASEVDAFAQWRKTGQSYELTDRASWWNSFTESVESAVARGVRMRRARVVSEPPTEYIKFEHYLTARNLAVGEEVRWLPRSQASDLMLPGNDFWLFDDRLIRFHHFSGDGDLLDYSFADDAALIARCSEAFEAVWERAVPHDQYTV
jgi:hypothetical protein